MSEERVVEVLKALRDADRECEAGPEVEAQLVLALRRRRAARMWTRAGAVAIAAGVGAIMLLHGRRPEPVRPSLPPVIAMSQVAAPSPPATVPASKPRAARTKSPVLQEVDTEFYPLMEFDPPFERGELVRVTVRASAMADVGLFVNPTHLDDPVQADVLIGQEGLARAIRFVSYQ